MKYPFIVPMDINIRKICERVYAQLGGSHTEHVYQKALQIELYNIGAVSVETEKHVPVFYTDTLNNTHTLSDERIDLFARFSDNTIVIMELKSVKQMDNVSVYAQMKKYLKALENLNIHPTLGIMVNFPPPNKENIEFVCIQL